METVYLETTVVGHLAGRMHPDPIVAARQTTTRAWWSSESHRFRVYVSQLVLDECAGGDPSAATERLQEVQALDLLASATEVDDLVKALIAGKAIPASEPRDAFHIAIAAVHGIKYLLTWNFKHIANASLRPRIEQICRDAGFEPPIICTPDELTEAADES
jgi:predicted nucleic acid-binding protein